MGKFYMVYDVVECSYLKLFRNENAAIKCCKKMTAFTKNEHQYFIIELPSPYVVLVNDGAKADIKIAKDIDI